MELDLFRPQIELDQKELRDHVQSSLNESLRDLAWARTSAVATLYAVLTVFNFFALDDGVNRSAALFSIVVVIAFAGFSLYHYFSNYPAYKTNGVMFIELIVLQTDSIAFSLATDNIMSGLGLYILIVCVGVFMTSVRWITTTLVLLVVSWSLTILYQETALSFARESLMMVSAVFSCYFLYFMRLRSAKRLSAHQLMEQKYKEGLENAIKEIETLSGLLPICVGCKNIRDDANEWLSVEEYVSDRSEAEFTHSLCPECKHRLYPELD